MSVISLVLRLAIELVGIATAEAELEKARERAKIKAARELADRLEKEKFGS